MHLIELRFKNRLLTHMDEKNKTIVQFIKFGIVGVSNTVVGYCINIATLKMLEKYQLSWDYVAANLIAFFLSVLWSFFWNNRYVFEETDL